MKVLKKLPFAAEKEKKRDETASVVANIHGVTPDYVRKVRNGERENEDIMATLVDLEQGKSLLIQHLMKLVPIDAKREKHGKGKKNK